MSCYEVRIAPNREYAFSPGDGIGCGHKSSLAEAKIGVKGPTKMPEVGGLKHPLNCEASKVPLKAQVPEKGISDTAT